MQILQACKVVADARRALAPDAVLVTTMSAMFALDHLGETHRRIDSVPLMGGAAGLALGLALARPDLPVIVVDGDSSLLMELGGLVTVAHARPRHMVHIVANNGVQFSGIVNMARPGGSEPGCDFAAMARAAGYPEALTVRTPAELAKALNELLAEPQLAFIDLVIEAEPAAFGAQRPQPFMPDRQFDRMRDAAIALRAELASHT